MSHALSHRKKPDVGAIGILDEDLPPWESGPIDLPAWFDPTRRDRPLEMEIGSGKGTFLVRHAAASPDVNLIGLEYAKPYWRHAADRCRRHGLTHVRLVRVEAAFFIRHYVGDGALAEAHVYFPDPWPKARHHKRRLIQPAFLRTLHAKLRPRAAVRVVTDHDGYFEWIGEAAAAVEDLFERLPYEPAPSVRLPEMAGTNFERKYRTRGQGFHGLVLSRKSATPR